MRTPYEELIVERLKRYQKKEKIKQIELAERLRWSPTKLNNILQKRDPVGKNLLQQISELGISIEIKEKENALKKLDDDDIEIAEMAHHLTKGQKDALKSIIHELAKKQSEAA